MTRNKPKLLESERSRILSFVMSHVIPDASVKGTPTGEIFRAYQAWCIDMGWGKPCISVDAFGRMLPKGLKRSTIGWAGNTTCRVILNVRLA